MPTQEPWLARFSTCPCAAAKGVIVCAASAVVLFLNDPGCMLGKPEEHLVPVNFRATEHYCSRARERLIGLSEVVICIVPTP